MCIYFCFVNKTYIRYPNKYTHPLVSTFMRFLKIVCVRESESERESACVVCLYLKCQQHRFYMLQFISYVYGAGLLCSSCFLGRYVPFTKKSANRTNNIAQHQMMLTTWFGRLLAGSICQLCGWLMVSTAISKLYLRFTIQSHSNRNCVLSLVRHRSRLAADTDTYQQQKFHHLFEYWTCEMRTINVQLLPFSIQLAFIVHNKAIEPQAQYTTQ